MENNPAPSPPSEDAIRRNLLDALMDSTSDHIYFKDEQSRFTMISRSMVQFFNLRSPAEVIGHTDFDFFSEEHARKAFEDEQAIMRTGVALVDREEKETWRDGHATWVSSTKMPLFAPDGRVIGTFGISRDITARKHMEEELARQRDQLEANVEARTRELRTAYERLQQEIAERERAEKALLEGVRMAAIRNMAGGVAVAFNNVLGIISSYAASIAANFIPKTRVHDEALGILEATKRAIRLTERLTAMAHANEPDKAPVYVPVSLAEVIQEATDFVGDMFRDKNVVIHVQHADPTPFVMGDRALLVDALLSMLLNAAEAMPGGGTVKVKAGLRKVLRPPGKRRREPGGMFAMLSVSDVGIGMPPDVRKRVFEPFFTTKKTEGSVGLGLTIAHSTIAAMGGWIRVSSRPGRGATFRVFLPEVHVSEDARRAAAGPRGARAITALVIDDEAEYVEAMRRTLEKAGCHVLTADGVPSGSALYAKHQKGISLVILDALMPDGGSARLVKRIRRLQPQACILLTSGFSRDFVRGLIAPGPWGFLQKPFDGAQLVKAARETIERFAATDAS